MTANTETAKTRDLTITRRLDAPVELVWRAWTSPEYVMRWWGPSFFTSPRCEMDLREGGATLVAMRSPEGQDFYSTWNYETIEPLRRLAFTQTLSDEHGQRLDPATLGLPADFPLDTRTVVVFTPVGDQTEMTITEYEIPDSPMGEMAELGLNQSLDKLAASLRDA